MKAKTKEQKAKRDQAVGDAVHFTGMVQRMFNMFPPGSKILIMIHNDQIEEELDVFVTNEDTSNVEKMVERLRKNMTERNEVPADAEVIMLHSGSKGAPN